MADGILPRLPIYVDSPLATDISLVYDEYGDDVLTDDDVPVEFLETREEAHLRSTQPDPCVIVASGGMCEGGRIIRHLMHHIDDPRATVMLVSYQAPQSLGSQMLERCPTVRFHGRKWNKWAEVVELNGFSGHADQEDFRALLGSAVGLTGRVRLVHGEVSQSEALAQRLTGMGFADVGVPHREETVSIGH
jgi:metallo-beta-lactamase family protein